MWSPGILHNMIPATYKDCSTNEQDGGWSYGIEVATGLHGWFPTDAVAKINDNRSGDAAAGEMVLSSSGELASSFPPFRQGHQMSVICSALRWQSLAQAPPPPLGRPLVCNHWYFLMACLLYFSKHS